MKNRRRTPIYVAMGCGGSRPPNLDGADGVAARSAGSFIVAPGTDYSSHLSTIGGRRSTSSPFKIIKLRPSTTDEELHNHDQIKVGGALSSSPPPFGGSTGVVPGENTAGQGTRAQAQSATQSSAHSDSSTINTQTSSSINQYYASREKAPALRLVEAADDLDGHAAELASAELELAEIQLRARVNGRVVVEDAASSRPSSIPFTALWSTPSDDGATIAKAAESAEGANADAPARQSQPTSELPECTHPQEQHPPQKLFQVHWGTPTQPLQPPPILEDSEVLLPSFSTNIAKVGSNARIQPEPRHHGACLSDTSSMDTEAPEGVPPFDAPQDAPVHVQQRPAHPPHPLTQELQHQQLASNVSFHPPDPLTQELQRQQLASDVSFHPPHPLPPPDPLPAEAVLQHTHQLPPRTKESAIATAELKAMLDAPERLGGCGGSGFAALLEARDAEDVLYGAEGLTSMALLDGTPPQASGPTPAIIKGYHADLVAAAVAAATAAPPSTEAAATAAPTSTKAAATAPRMPPRPSGYPSALGRWLRAPTVSGAAASPTATNAATHPLAPLQTLSTLPTSPAPTRELPAPIPAQSSFVYIHTWTQQMSLAQPANSGPFEDEANERDRSGNAAAQTHDYPTTAVGAALNRTVDGVVNSGKIPLLLCPTATVHAAVIAEAVTWDGRGLAADAWRADRAVFDANVEIERAAYESESHEAYVRAVEEWHEETTARKERRREVDLDGGAEYVSSDEEEAVALPPPYPGPAWDGTYLVATDPFVLPFKKTKIKVSDHVEHCRKKIVLCMKAGGTLVVDLGEGCPDFENKIAIQKYRGAFPLELFNPAEHSACSKNGIFVRSKGDGPPTVKEGFAVVVVALQTPFQFKKALEDLTDAINAHLEPVVCA